MRAVSGHRHILGAVMCLGGAVAPALSGAQEVAAAPAPCHLQACGLAFDWGSGKTSANYPSDRRYGSGDDFEAKMRSALADHGVRTKDAPADGPLLITLKPTMRPRSMCDAMAGTSTDMSCTSMSDLTVTFASSDPAVKAPNAMHFSNRCGARDTFMTMAQFGQYAADMLYYALEGAQKKEARPVMRC
ncbi:MAG TPA: hypothetical protein VHE78_03275 [Gemmatimonadaceae bacterium]|nr:hypothetical protein [Gemmatimonadaceae bacterium]